MIEIVSMHGVGERDESPRPYLHVMGPSDHASTMQAGLDAGHFFGVIGSTDHHAAHPGSYGHGRTGVWAERSTRSAIWQAILERRTCALTGDRIEVQYALNDAAMGSDLPYSRDRRIDIAALVVHFVERRDVVRDALVYFQEVKTVTRFDDFGD